MTEKTKELILESLDRLILETKIELGKSIQDGKGKKVIYKKRVNEIIEFKKLVI